MTIRRLTASHIRAQKGGPKIVMLTAYHAFTARVVDTCCDVILVGDSLGNVLYGFDTTLPVTLEMMILHGRAVVQASKRALVVVDLPFGTYESSREQAFASASRIMRETGCGAVKLEGGKHVQETISFLCERGIPVMGHIGLTPQSIHSLGSFRSQGHEEAAQISSGGNMVGPIEEDGQAIAKAGAFSMVIEAVAEPLARRISATNPIPTIGIGASPACDGQVLVLEDLLGFSQRTPKFVRRYAEFEQSMRAAVDAYAADVRSGMFPSTEYLYGVKAD